MNDRFKFRVWDEVNNKFFAQEVLNALPLEVFLASKHIQQHTGLEDKNGAPIYEGDIIKFINEYANAKEKNEIGEIIYCNGAFWAKTKDAFFYFDTEPEVIGNVFENKELLKEYE
jgi:uncharacterized phage protein (TIGR01671 family)